MVVEVFVYLLPGTPSRGLCALGGYRSLRPGVPYWVPTRCASCASRHFASKRAELEITFHTQE